MKREVIRTARVGSSARCVLLTLAFTASIVQWRVEASGAEATDALISN
jgi:hypothetical protein